MKLKIEQLNYPKEDESRLLKTFLEERGGSFLGRPFYIEMRYFKSGRDAFNWKTARMLGEQGFREMVTVALESEELFQMLEWVCRWADGTISVLVVEDNLKRFARGDKEAIKGLGFHILGHIADMDERDFFTSFQEWEGEAQTKEESDIFSRARDIVLEYSAERIALERGGVSALTKCRGKTSQDYEWVKKELKRYKKDLRKVKTVKLPTKKEYILGTSLVFLAYKMAWKKVGCVDIYWKIFESAKKKLSEIYSEMGIAEHIRPTEMQAEEYVQELETVLSDVDLTDIRAVNDALVKFVS